MRLVEQLCFTSVAGGNPTLPEYGRGFFCASEDDKGCSSEHTHKMACQVMGYQSADGGGVPSDSQYFSEAALGGPVQADYCPVYGNTYHQKTFEELDCRITANTPAFPNSYSETYGPNSKCLVSSSGEARCYESFCVEEDMTFRFSVVGRFYICEEDFEQKQIPLSDGTIPQTIKCPRLSQVCPALFCPFNCASRDICDYTNQVNGFRSDRH